LRFYGMQTMADMAAIEKMQDYGTEIISLTEEIQREVERAAVEYYDELAAKDPFFAEVLQSQREFAKAYRELQNFQYPYYVK